jgi:hypothetical protein
VEPVANVKKDRVMTLDVRQTIHGAFDGADAVFLGDVLLLQGAPPVGLRDLLHHH